MTTVQTKLIAALLAGHFLMRSKRCYTLFDEALNPLQRVRFRTVDKIDQYMDPKKKLWKKDKKGRITLNLASVRQLHGRSIIKKLYKKTIKVDITGSLYKTKKRKAKTALNEKINYLF